MLNIEISKILSVINNKHYTDFKDFDYRGVKGHSKLVGWEIILFSHDKETISVIKINLNSDHEIINNESSTILRSLNKSINEHISLSEINSLIKPFYIEEDIMSDAMNYFYKTEKGLLIIGFEEDKIASLEYSESESVNEVIKELIDEN